MSYGPDWYAGEAYSGPRSFAEPDWARKFAGRYRSDSAWGGDVRVFALKGKLVADGTPLTPLGNGLFRVGEDEWGPVRAEFVHLFEGRARVLKLGGLDFWRVDVG